MARTVAPSRPLLLLRRRPRAALPAGAREIAEAATGTLALAAIVTGCLGFALAGAERPSFLSPNRLRGDPGWLAGPLAGAWPSLTRSIGELRWAASVALLAMLACWLIAVACARRVGLGPVLVALAAAVTLMSLAPSFSLTDTFNYLHYGRMGALYGTNPYSVPPAAVPIDPAYRWSTWHHLRSPYGPLFTLATEGLAHLGLAGGYWVLKASIALATVALAALIALLARRLGRDPATAVAFALLNPLVLVYGVGGAHNDPVVLALLLGGVLLAMRRREPAGGAAWTAAVAIKLSAGLALPILLAGGAWRRRGVMLGIAAGAVAAGLLVIVAFGGRLPNDSQQSRLVMGEGLPNLLGVALGRGGLDAGLRHVLTVVLVVGTLALAAWTWRTRDWAATAAWAAVLLVATLGWAMPWYVLWAAPFAALARRPGPRAAVVALSVYLFLAWAPAGAPALHRLGVHVTHTPVGHANNVYLHGLLK